MKQEMPVEMICPCPLALHLLCGYFRPYMDLTGYTMWDPLRIKQVNAETEPAGFYPFSLAFSLTEVHFIWVNKCWTKTIWFLKLLWSWVWPWDRVLANEDGTEVYKGTFRKAPTCISYLFERENERAHRGRTEGEGKADPLLSTEPEAGLDPMTPRSWSWDHDLNRNQEFVAQPTEPPRNPPLHFLVIFSLPLAYSAEAIPEVQQPSWDHEVHRHLPKVAEKKARAWASDHVMSSH